MTDCCPGVGGGQTRRLPVYKKENSQPAAACRVGTHAAATTAAGLQWAGWVDGWMCGCVGTKVPLVPDVSEPHLPDGGGEENLEPCQPCPPSWLRWCMSPPSSLVCPASDQPASCPGLAEAMPLSVALSARPWAPDTWWGSPATRCFCCPASMPARPGLPALALRAHSNPAPAPRILSRSAHSGRQPLNHRSGPPARAVILALLEPRRSGLCPSYLALRHQHAAAWTLDTGGLAGIVSTVDGCSPCHRCDSGSCPWERKDWSLARPALQCHHRGASQFACQADPPTWGPQHQRHISTARCTVAWPSPRGIPQRTGDQRI